MSRRSTATALSIILVVCVSTLLSTIPVGARSLSVSSQASAKQGPAVRTNQVGHVISQRVSTKTIPQAPFSGKGIASPNLLGPALVHQSALPRTGALAVTPPQHTRIKPYTASLTGFAGQADTGIPPSDSNADSGPYNVVEAVNEQWNIFDRSGNPQYSTTFSNWFGTSAFDPVVQYDPWGGRFFLLVDTGSSIKISVAQQTNALGNWCNYTFPISPFADYPRFGFDVNGIYFSANVYTSDEKSFLYTILYQVDRGQMESCATANDWEWDHIKNPDGSLVYTLVPAFKYTYDSAHNEEYLVDKIFGAACNVIVWRITTNHVLYNASVGTQCYSTPTDASQSGSQGTIATSANGKTLYQASYRDGLLDMAMGSSYDWGNGKVRSIVLWFKIDPVADSVVQQGAFGNPDYWYFFPAIQQESTGQTVIVWNASGSSIYPSIWYTGQNSHGSLQGALALVWGSSAYGTSGQARWGDYQSARLDPTNWTHVWICGQYAANNSKWGTWIGNVTAS